VSSSPAALLRFRQLCFAMQELSRTAADFFAFRSVGRCCDAAAELPPQA